MNYRLEFINFTRWETIHWQQIKRNVKTNLLGNTHSNTNVCIVCTYREKRIVPLPLYFVLRARAFMCRTCTYAASVALLIYVFVYGSKLFRILRLPNSTHWNPITNRCCAFYCRCRSVNGIVACRMLCKRTNWPMRSVCLSPTERTSQLFMAILWYDWLGWHMSKIRLIRITM